MKRKRPMLHRHLDLRIRFHHPGEIENYWQAAKALSLDN